MKVFCHLYAPLCTSNCPFPLYKSAQIYIITYVALSSNLYEPRQNCQDSNLLKSKNRARFPETVTNGMLCLQQFEIIIKIGVAPETPGRGCQLSIRSVLCIFYNSGVDYLFQRSAGLVSCR